MTYALSWPLQQALYGALSADPQVAALSGGRIYDAVPQTGDLADLEEIYVALGDERAEDWSTAERRGAIHQVLVSVVAPRAGFAEAKALAGAVSDALLAASLSPSRGHVVNITFLEARTLRAVREGIRQIEMRFRIAVEDTN